MTAWRETSVRVLNVSGTKLCTAGGEYLRVRLMPPAAREIAVRTGRVWLDGPDTRGRLAVRVDGLVKSWSARRIPPVQATAALPTAEPLTEVYLRPRTETKRLAVWIYIVLTCVWNTVRLALLPVPGWVVYSLGILGVAGSIGGLVSVFWFRRLRPTAPWFRADAEVWTYRAGWFGAGGTVALTLPDERTFIAHLRWAPFDLFANVRQENALWISGDRIVGFPQYAILASARLVVTPESRTPSPV